MFRVGQKVAAVAFEYPDGTKVPQNAPNLKIGNVYTIRDIDQRTVPLYGAPTIRLHEVSGNIIYTQVGLWECGYHPSCFRPLIERKTDISIFTAMLTPKSEDAHV